jgi:hypothetical protein
LRELTLKLREIATYLVPICRSLHLTPQINFLCTAPYGVANGALCPETSRESLAGNAEKRSPWASAWDSMQFLQNHWLIGSNKSASGIRHPAAQRKLGNLRNIQNVCGGNEEDSHLLSQLFHCIDVLA